MKAGLVIAAIVIGATAAQAQSQMELNNQAREEREKEDRRLNQAYANLMKRLRPEDQARLRQAQTTWIGFRDQECAFETAGSIGGSVHGMVLAYCQAYLTGQRATDLERLLKCEERNLSCPPMVR